MEAGDLRTISFFKLEKYLIHVRVFTQFFAHQGLSSLKVSQRLLEKLHVLKADILLVALALLLDGGLSNLTDGHLLV